MSWADRIKNITKLVRTVPPHCSQKKTEGTLQDLRVLVIATTFPRRKDDTEPKFVFDLTQRLSKKVCLWVLVPHAPGAKIYEEIDGVKIIRFPYFFPKSLQRLCYDGGILPNMKNSWVARIQVPFFLIAQCFFIFKIVRRLKINFVHCHWIIPQGFFVGLYNVFFNIPYILTAHGGDVFSFKENWLISRMKQFSLRHSQMCTVNSLSTLQAIRNTPYHGSAEIIPMGVDTDLFHPNKFNAALKLNLQIEGLFLLGVGRFAEIKGFRYLISAMPIILEKYPATKLVLIGFGPHEKELRSLISQLKLSDSVILPGSQSGVKLAEYFATADVFIGPSVVTEEGAMEGQGLVFLEAMASNTAVIASNVGGIIDMIEDGRTGLLVPQKDPESIAAKILLLAGDKDLREQLAHNAKEVIENRYSWKVVANAFIETYHKILNK